MLSGGESTNSTFDINALVAGESQVFFRLHFNVPENLASYYQITWEIESVTIEGNSGVPMLTIPWEADFTSGQVPEGWTHQIIEEGSGWGFYTSPAPHTVIYGVPGMPHVNARLITPIFDLSDETTVTLNYLHRFVIYDPNNSTTTQIQYSEDGINWTPLNINFTGAGTYSYLVELDGYQDNTGNVEIIDQDVDLTITMNEITYPVTFQVSDYNFFTVSDAIITLNGVANAAGQYQFNLTPGTYSYNVSKEGFTDLPGSFEVTNQSQSISITLITSPIPPSTLPFYENFNGLTSAQLPTGWHRTTRAWMINPTTEAGAEAPEISYDFVNFNVEGTSTLMTPWIDPQDATELLLSLNDLQYDNLGFIYPFTLSIQGSHDLENWETMYPIIEMKYQILSIN